MADPRVGLGFDVHPNDPSRALTLAGVAFENEPGLAGHSDADVVSHALADALFGAAGLGDIGDHFPDEAPETAGLPGLELLARSAELVRGAGLHPASCDVVLVAHRPHVADSRDEMRANIARALGLEPDRVSVKATRPEGLGLTGEGAGCLAVAVLVER